MKRASLIASVAVLIGLAAAAPAIQSVLTQPRAEPVIAVPTDTPSPTPRNPTLRNPTTRAATPMAQRVATVGILNKRNGLSRDLAMKPGQAVRIGDAVVRLKACDQTEPWEREQLTGGFVQLIVRGADNKWRKVFSGWLFKETPSLNVVEHPIYDIWVKDCTMRHPEIGPETVVMSGDDSDAADERPRARKSPSPPVDSAEPSDLR